MKLNNNDDSHNSGLNLLIYNMLLDIESHPAWVCGLKHIKLALYFRTLQVTPCVGVYGLKHCSLVGQIYGRIVSIRPLVYFSSSCYKVKSQTKYVRLLTLL